MRATYRFAVWGAPTTAAGCLTSRRIGSPQLGTACFVNAQMLPGHTQLLRRARAIPASMHSLAPRPGGGGPARVAGSEESSHRHASRRRSTCQQDSAVAYTLSGVLKVG